MFTGYSENISMEEIYRVDINSSIYQFTIQTGPHEANTTATIEGTLQYLIGMDGSNPTLLSGLLRRSLLSSSEEICATFSLLWDKSVKEYVISLAMFEESESAVYMKGFMSLPSQARSFDQFQIFKDYELQDGKRNFLDFTVYSLKVLQKRNTATEPCIDVHNYDKVHNSTLPL